MNEQILNKLVSYTLCATMVMGMLSGCGSKNDDTNPAVINGSTERISSAADAEANRRNDEITEIIWQYPTTMDTNSDGFIAMENTLNLSSQEFFSLHFPAHVGWLLGIAP